MKRSFNLFVFLFCFLSLSLGQGVQNLRIAAKAGINISSFSGNGTDDISPGIGIHVGALASADILESLGAQVEIFFSTQGGTEFSNSLNSDVRIMTNYISIPTLARYTIIDGLSVFAGPQFSILTTAKGKVKTGPFARDEPYDNKDDTPSLDVAIVFGGSYEVIDRLHADLRFVIGLTDSNKDPGTFFHRVVQIGAAYDLIKQ